MTSPSAQDQLDVSGRGIRRIRLGLAAALLLVAPLAACSADGGGDEDAKSTTTTEKSDDRTSTTEGDDETSTTEGGGGGTDDLESLLPAADDLGSGWEETYRGPEKADEPSEFDAVIEDQCPEVAKLLEEFDADSDEDNRLARYENGDVEAEVNVGTPDSSFTAPNVAKMVKAVNACSIDYTDPEMGNNYKMEFKAQEDDAYGDLGYMMQANMQVSLPEQGSVEFSMYTRFFNVGDLAVQLQLTDGISSDGKVTDADTADIDRWADEMETALQDA